MLVWIDLEMTGLNPNYDHILEIASLITTNELDHVADGPNLVIHQPEKYLNIMKEPVISMHQVNGLTDEVRKSKISLEEAASQTLSFIKEYLREPYSSPLCGNTVWTDRNFLSSYMPEVDKYLHYRCLDVSTLKELMKRWMPEVAKTIPVKPKNHRALEDIRTSVKELSHYKEHLFDLVTKNPIESGISV